MELFGPVSLQAPGSRQILTSRAKIVQKRRSTADGVLALGYQVPLDLHFAAGMSPRRSRTQCWLHSRGVWDTVYEGDKGDKGLSLRWRYSHARRFVMQRQSTSSDCESACMRRPARRDVWARVSRRIVVCDMAKPKHRAVYCVDTNNNSNCQHVHDRTTLISQRTSGSFSNTCSRRES